MQNFESKSSEAVARQKCEVVAPQFNNNFDVEKFYQKMEEDLSFEEEEPILTKMRQHDFDQVIDLIGWNSCDIESQDEVNNESDSEGEENFSDMMQKGLVRYVVSNRFCCHQPRKYQKCGCMFRMKILENKYYFDEQSLNDLYAICYELRLREFTRRDNFEAGNYYHKHMVTVICLTTGDKKLICDPSMSREKFMSFVYELRSHYGLTHDFGNKKEYSLNLEAQSVGDFFNNIVSMVKNMIGKAACTSIEVINAVFEKIIDSLKFALNVISETIGNILEKIFKLLRRMIIKILDPVRFIKENFTQNGGFIIIVSVISIAVLLQLIGIFTINIVGRLIDTFIKWFKNDDLEGEAEAPSDPIAGFITLTCLVLGLSYSDFTSISKRCREFNNLVSSGIAGSFLMSSLFLVLPIAVQSALKLKFGSESDKEKVLLEDWMLRANAVVRLKKIPKVLVSKEYRDWISELITEAQGLKLKIKNPVNANIFVRILVSMMEILSMLENYDLEKSYRDYPFSLHIAAPAGYGKTLFVSKFMRDLFDTEERDVYTRPINDEFWSGFINQKLVLFDEFLIGDHDDAARHAKEYLEIVSTKVFKPPLASVDDVAVGIKGTRCEPLGVITINNQPYSTVTNFDRHTLFRRRHHVIRLKIKPNYQQYFSDNTLKLSMMTDEQIKNIDWLEFELLPCSPGNGNVGFVLNYTDMVAFLRNKYNEHRITCQRIKEGLNNEINEDLTPTQLLENAMRELRGVPNEPKGLTEALFDLLSDSKDNICKFFNFNAEGPGTTPQGMDKSEGLKPRQDTKELEIYKILKYTKSGRNKSKEGIIRRLRKAQELLEQLPFSDNDEILLDRRIVRGLLKKKIESFGLTEELSFPGISDDDSFATASSDDEPVISIQKDVESDIAHTNVNPQLMHRHACLGLYKEFVLDERGNRLMNLDGSFVIRTARCDKHFAHKHSDLDLDHKFLCPSCIKRGAEESFLLVHGGANYHGKQITTHNCNLLPDDYQSCFMGEDENFKQRMDDLWSRIIVDKYLSFGYIPYVFIDTTGMSKEERAGGPEIYWEYSPKDKVKSMFMNMVKWVSIYTVIIAAWKLISMDKTTPKNLCFGAESPRAQKVTHLRRSRKNFINAQAQSGGNLTFEINGKEHNAIPIKGQTFMTYYHSILNEDDSLIDSGVEMKIKWRNVSDIIRFDISMTQSSVEDDLLFITFVSKKIPQFPDIVKKFWTMDDVDNFEATSGTINIDMSPKYVTLAKVKNKNYSYFKHKFEMSECLMYRYPTMKGDCGSTVISCGQHYPGKILGMHVAGGSRNGDSFGLAVIVTREDIEDALKLKVENNVEAEFIAEGPGLLEIAPNLRKVVDVPLNEVVHVNRVSKLSKSCISDLLPWRPLKHKPIMSVFDERSQGYDPMIKALNVALEVNHDESTIDLPLLTRCAEATLNNYKRKLKWPLGKRRLTFEEALIGVPGILCSIRVKTSAGYPLCKVANRSGKRQFFQFGPNGELWYDPNFRIMCEQYVRRMETVGINERRFIAYLKDELVSDNKVERVKTRIIYAGDLISNVAYRMIFGSLLAAFNSSFEDTPSAVGLNQYSHDMHLMYDYLSEVGNRNFVAGDIDEWDKHQMRPVLKLGYWVWSELAKELTNEIGLLSFYNQQNFSPAQFSDKLIYFVVTYYSGLFLTTIMNNITHENHIRYIFAKQNPTKIFDDHVRIKVGGDDHIYNFSDEVAPTMTPFKIREIYRELGHVYTSDVKEQELLDEFRSFEEITFLGAHPVLIDGKYCGALKKKTLQEMVHWTRNKDKSIREDCRMAMELSSVWGNEYYNEFCGSINLALRENGMEMIEMPVCSEMQRVVASRTAASGEDFPSGFFAQGPPVNSLAKLNEHKLVDGIRLNDSQRNKLASKALNEEAMGINFGTESRVFRAQFDWVSSDVPGVPIFQVDVPFGLLSLGDSDNVQNMGFDRFVFWKGDIEVSFQINGTPFQQGLLVAYFVPLADYSVELANITTCSHVKIQPDQSSTYTLCIPFLYLRSVMNTIARSTESLGTIFVTPLSSLSAVDNNTVTLTMYSAYPNSNFTIPRPLQAEPGMNKFYNVHGQQVIDFDRDFEGPFEAQGNVSSTSISNYWSAGGDMPIESIENTAGAQASQDLSADVKIPMPLDNPPLCSGAFPVVQAYSGMASSHGVRATTDLQLKPATLSRQQMEIFNPAESKFETLLAHQCLLTKFTVSTAMPPGTELYRITLNTRMGIAEGNNIPINIAVLNQFMFWRCDIELTFVSVQTRFHSMRLQALTAYGAPGIVSGSRNVNYTSNMSFASDDSSTNYLHRELIPYNAQTEFLRTYEGEGVTDPIQNYALGTFGVFVLNSLIAPDTVPSSVEVLVFLRFVNPKLAVPRPNSPFTWNNYLEYVPTPAYGFRGISEVGGLIRAYGLDRDGLTGFPKVPKTSIQWSGATPVNGMYNLVNPYYLTFFYREYLGIGSFSVTLQIFSIEITATELIFQRFSEAPGFTVDPAISYLSTPDFIFIKGPVAIDEVIFGAQGPDVDVVEDVNPTATGENTEVGELTILTKMETQKRENKPCKWEIGEKFEFTITDIHEIGRRYIRSIPINNVELDQFSVQTFTASTTQVINHLNVPVQPQNMWRGLFAAWAGSVKYRIFRNSEGFLPQVIFVPFYNRDVTQPGLPIIDAMQDLIFLAYSNAYTSVSSITGPLAREVLYPISDVSYIDVSAPFQSHYNFCYNSKTQSIAPISSGTLTLSYGGDTVPTYFTAFGDDLRLGIYRPPQTTTLNLTVFTNGIGGFQN